MQVLTNTSKFVLGQGDSASRYGGFALPNGKVVAREGKHIQNKPKFDYGAMNQKEPANP